MKSIKHKTLHLPVMVEQDEDNIYIVSCPVFKGCHSYGKTIDEALEMIKDAMRGWLEVAKEEGIDIPEEVEKAVFVTH